MKREQIIHSVVAQFEKKLAHMSDDKLTELEAGKFEISLTPAVGQEAGGAAPSKFAVKSNLAGSSKGSIL